MNNTCFFFTCSGSCSNIVGDHGLSAVWGGGRGDRGEATAERDRAASAGADAGARRRQEEEQARAQFGDGSGPSRYTITQVPS